MKVGLLGGSFDPIHIGHLVVAEEATWRLGLERVVFVPGRLPPHKLNRRLAPAHDRLRMVQLAIEGNIRFEASEIEVRREGPSYSIQTVSELRQASGGEWDIYFLIGADTLPELPTWHRVRELADACKFVVFSRPGASLDALGALRGALGEDQIAAIARRRFHTPLIGVSSSDIRRRVRQGRSIRYLVPDAVRHYIADRGLYREP